MFHREGNEKPVIVVLNPQLVYEKIKHDFDPVPARLAAVMNIPNSLDFSLPWVQDAFDSISFQQGRHRTAALAKLGFLAYPVLTEDEGAQGLLEKFAAPVALAAKYFDWRHLVEYPTVRMASSEYGND